MIGKFFATPKSILGGPSRSQRQIIFFSCGAAIFSKRKQLCCERISDHIKRILNRRFDFFRTIFFFAVCKLSLKIATFLQSHKTFALCFTPYLPLASPGPTRSSSLLPISVGRKMKSCWRKKENFIVSLLVGKSQTRRGFVLPCKRNTLSRNGNTTRLNVEQ